MPPPAAYRQEQGAPSIWGVPAYVEKHSLEPVPLEEPVTSTSATQPVDPYQTASTQQRPELRPRGH